MGKVKDGPCYRGGNDNNTNIDKIIGNQDIGKESFGFIQQVKHQAFLTGRVFFQLTDMHWAQAEIGHLRTGDHGRAEKQNSHDHHAYNGP